MPSLGADMSEGTLLEWLVSPGDVVHRGDIIAVVDTSKSAIDIEVFEDGRIDELLVEPGTTVAVGAPLAMLGAIAAGTGAPAAAAPVASPIVRHLAHARGVDLATVPGTGRAGAVTRADLDSTADAGAPAGHDTEAHDGVARVSASPYARRRAAELGVDVRAVHGTGGAGVITVADVEAAASASAEAPVAAPPQVRPEPAGTGADRPTAMRQAIGALMARSKREIPHYYLQTTIDLHRALAWLERANAERPVAERILPAALLFKAAARAARDVPDMNGFFVDGAFRASEHVHLGVAVSLRGGGLIAPALHDADTLPVPELMAALKDLATRARNGRLRGSEMSDPTLTATNMGEQGVEAVHGVIYPPQVALVGFGRVVERPWAVDGMLTVRRVLITTLAADHRVSDGHRGGLYLSAIDAALQNPEEL